MKLLNNKILRAGVISLLATVITRAINFISIPIFSRLLSSADYGRVDVFMTYVNIFMIIIGLDFQGAVGKGRLDYRECVDDYLGASVCFSTFVAIGMFTIVNVVYSLLSGWIGMDRLLINVMLIYSYAMFLMSFKVTDYNFQFAYSKNLKMSGVVALLNLVLSILMIMTVFSDKPVLGRAIGATIPTMVCAIIIWFSYCRRCKWKIKGEYVKYSLKFGVPLILHNLSHMVLSSSDKLMIISMIGASESGIYSLTYTLGLLIQVFSEALNQVFAPWLFRMLDADNDHIVTIAQKGYLLIYSMVTIFVMAFSPEILRIIGPKEYWDGVSIIMWVVFATFINFTYTIYVNIEFFEKRTALISTGTIIAAIINVVLNALFLKKYGYQFGVVSTVIAYLALLCFHCFIVNYILKSHVVDNIFIWFVVICMIGMTIVMHTIRGNLPLRITIGMVGAVVVMVALFGWYKKNKVIVKDIKI